MNYQNNPQNTDKDTVPSQAAPVTVRKRPRLGSENTEENDYIGIDLAHEPAIVQSGKGDEWNLSQIGFTSAIQQVTIFENNTQVGDYDETSVNCITYSSQKRIEIYTSELPGATPYIVFQEVENQGIVGWQVYAPIAFYIESPPSGGQTSWQSAVSAEPVSIKEVRVYDNCNFNIENPPPPGSMPMFEKVTSMVIGEIDIQN